ncbi:MAG TPA: hypothetical protein VKP00_05000 [Gemmatimonadaceae bacterium]|nr:hypothetical protein [Gemmatimonadaceae bacterium]
MAIARRKVQLVSANIPVVSYPGHVTVSAVHVISPMMRVISSRAAIG